MPPGISSAASGVRGAHLSPAVPPFTRKRSGAHYVWADEISLALSFSEANGFALQLSSAPYEVAVLSGDDFRLLIYPHTTKGTRNQHLRVRDHGSKNKRRAQAVIAVLDRAAGFNCTFSFHWPNNPLAHQWARDLLSPAKRPAIYAEAGTAEPLVSPGRTT